jgi:hypothetical protein
MTLNGSDKDAVVPLPYFCFNVAHGCNQWMIHQGPSSTAPGKSKLLHDVHGTQSVKNGQAYRQMLQRGKLPIAHGAMVVAKVVPSSLLP